MKTTKEKRWTKDGEEDLKFIGLIEEGAASLDEKSEIS